MTYRLALPEGPFGTVYADPPWTLTTPGVRRRLHYDRMTTEDICAMDVASITTPDAHLWLWTTNAHLPEALRVVAEWGFEYRSLLTWAKPKMGTGWWLRGKTEHVIFASRSKASRHNPGNVTTLLTAPVGAHSAKPSGVLDIIERLSPGPYIELFARHNTDDRPGWTHLVSEGLPAHDFDAGQPL